MRSLSTRVDPRPLAVARIGVGLSALLNVVDQVYTLRATTQGDVALPVSDWLPAVTGAGIAVYAMVALTAAIGLVVGVASRAAAGTLVLSTWFVFAWEQQTYSNHMMLTAWLALWLVLAPSDAAWSLRARVEGRGVVRFGDQVLLMSQLSVCYFFAALVKLNPGFLSGDLLSEFVSLDLPSWLWSAAALGAVVTEMGLVVGLWFRRTRWLAAAAGLGLHLSIPLAMPGNAWSLLAFSLQCLALYPLFLSLGVGLVQREPTGEVDVLVAQGREPQVQPDGREQEGHAADVEEEVGAASHADQVGHLGHRVRHQDRDDPAGDRGQGEEAPEQQVEGRRPAVHERVRRADQGDDEDELDDHEAGRSPSTASSKTMFSAL